MLHVSFHSRLLMRWMGKVSAQTRLWSEHMIDEISNVLLTYNTTRPKEIHRKIRSLKVMHCFKGTEFRTIMMYVGIVLFKDYLPTEEYDLFLKLFCAVTLCSTKAYSHKLGRARELFDEFIEGHINIYGGHNY